VFALDPVYQRPAMMIEGYRQILGEDERFRQWLSLRGRPTMLPAHFRTP
jgi:hypothetical protein